MNPVVLDQAPTKFSLDHAGVAGKLMEDCHGFFRIGPEGRDWQKAPQGGPNYYNFGANIRYEIHIDNNVNTPGDDIVYRVIFYRKDEDPSTFFNIRLGKQNLRMYYDVLKSTDGGKSFITIYAGGSTTPPNIGERSINSAVGLNSSYQTQVNKAIHQTHTGEK